MYLRNHFRNIIPAWREALSERSFALKLLLTPGLFFLYSAITQHLGNYVEMRKGIQLQDKLLTLLPSIDFSAPVFFLLYTSLALVIITHIDKPRIILRIIEMHFAVAVVRQICILLVALDPPAGLIVLRDLFLENTVYPRHSPLTKDLFFSGHVASIWLYFLCAEKKYIRYYMIGAALLMSFMILCMRVHYSYDVYGAFFFTTLIYFTPGWIKSYFFSKELASESSE
ncbi:MAG: hypothetical protein IPI46_09120 [Bacteroidetes bacterium]|nr:hypothetical protein [Bacteroidota bacterium]